MMSPRPPPNALFISLVEYPEVAAALCKAVASGQFHGEAKLRDVCALARVSQGRGFVVEKLLAAGVKAGAFTKCAELSWAPVAGVDFATCALMLDGVAIFQKDVYRPADQVGIVLTRPQSPSRLGAALDKLNYHLSFLENTQEIFSNLAATATTRFLVMTPFLDAEGAREVVELFEKTAPGVHKQLIVRCKKGQASTDLSSNLPSLKALNVRVANYWISREIKERYETFHSKVVLSDNQRCYVGSANMTLASLYYSMELGFLVEGEAAVSIGNVMDAVIQASVTITPGR